MRPSLFLASPLVAVLAAAAAPAAPSSRPATPATGVTDAIGNAEVVRTHRYRLSGRIRPLLVWMGKDDVGFARVTWRADRDGRPGYELLIGTDPARAPRRLNRWGLVAEQGTAAGGDVLALMTGAMAGSLAEANADASSGSPGARLRVLRGRLEGSTSRAHLASLGFERPPTIHDAEDVLARVRYEAVSTRETVAAAPDRARPGLLTAIAETLSRLVVAAREGQPTGTARGGPVPYVFGRDGYELGLRRIETVTAADTSGRPLRAIETEFEIRAIATGRRSRFWMRTAVEGPLAGVPLAVRWQPRWWLEVGMHLAE